MPERHRIRYDEVLAKCTVSDLIVIVGITPTSHPAGRIWIPKRAVLEGSRVRHEAN